VDIRFIAPDLSVSPQIAPSDIGVAASRGFRSVIINRPDGEGEEQPTSRELVDTAKRQGVEVRFIPVESGRVTDADVAAFKQAMLDLPAPTLAFCRTGTRSITLWALSQAGHLSADAILKTASEAGYDLAGLRPRLEAKAEGADHGVAPNRARDVVIIGGGAAGISTASSLLKRRPGLDIVIVEPREHHYYQPGWTLVGGGVFRREETERSMASVMPKGVEWVRSACAGFAPERNEVILEDGTRVHYRTLVVAPGLKLDWNAVDGLQETLGKNGVTSNYKFDLAPYTWELVSTMRGGRALFTQPPMPIKCAGAPQKAMYLSCDDWKRRGVLGNMEVHFHNAGGVLFGVDEYVPALMEYVDQYKINLNFNENLIAVDGAARLARFRVTEGEEVREETREFDMLHVCPPQTGHDFMKRSPLTNDAGWVTVDDQTLQHKSYGNVFGLGDGGSTPNAKTAAAVRKQAPVAAHNVLRALDGKVPNAVYDGYGSCPLTVERGKVVLAEFVYGGKVAPSFPVWLFDGKKPTRAAWFLKEKMLPPVYFEGMLKGREWLAGPAVLAHRPTVHDAREALVDPSSKTAA
jgi:sulfide:quinone oxidoreductase